MATTQFDTQQAQAIWKQIAHAWKQHLETLIAESEDGEWVAVTVKPGQMVAAAPDLALKPGYALHGYLYRENRDMNGVVWALPAGQALPAPADCDEDVVPDLSWALDRLDLEAPHPADAPLNTMDAITGEQTPLSYLAASLLGREFSEFGADYHGIYWGDFTLLEDSHLSETDWEWREDLPDAWQPQVEIYDNEIVVTFYSTSAARRHIIARHVDTYAPGNYAFETDEAIVATGGKGFNR
jgi:hypothetical protein